MAGSLQILQQAIYPRDMLRKVFGCPVLARLHVSVVQASYFLCGCSGMSKPRALEQGIAGFFKCCNTKASLTYPIQNLQT